MGKKLDVEKVDAALKRAARTAVTGSREDRSGRVMTQKPVKRSSSRSQGWSEREKPRKS